MADRLGEILVRENRITADQLRQAIEDQRQNKGRLAATLVRLGHLKSNELVEFFSKKYGVPAIKLADFQIDAEIAKVIPAEMADRLKAVPVNRAGSTLIVAMADPSDMAAIDDIKFMTSYSVEVVVSSEEEIKSAIERVYGVSQDEAARAMEETLSSFDDEGFEVVAEGDEDAGSLKKAADDAPVIKMVNGILLEAINRKASDIHVECYETEFRIRFRIDGDLYEFMKPPRKVKNALTSRLKIMANMDIAEHRIPQDGRIKIKVKDGREMDFRVSCLPVVFGEKIVLRLLDKSNLQLDMTRLGFEEDQIKLFREAGILQPYGMVLVTGPTGSGKTTTLYSALWEMNKPGVNIITAEDPVEYNLEGINQVQMQEDIGLNFAAALRAFLRQDPNVILVGEIRDFETAEIAIKAALTGQLVLSTLHTNDAPSSITRLINMGIEPFLVASAVNLIQAQRLVRKICTECKEPVKVSPEVLVGLGLTPQEAAAATVFKGRGCDKCNNIGYKGRLAIYEIMAMSEDLRVRVLENASDIELKKIAASQGMRTLRMSALRKMAQGITTMDEVVSVTLADEK